MRIAILLLAASFLAFAAGAQVPTPAEFHGYAPGERFTSHERIVDYFNELARKSDSISIEQYGTTYEGRPLVVATITSPKNRAALPTIRQNLAAIAAGEVTGERLEQIAASTPAVIWLGFGIHGNESSSSEAAMQIASTLLRDAEWRALLDDVVILIDPVENPDGRERYVEWYRRTRGVKPNPNPESFEHAEPWPGGRFNHYLMDLNRDWSWASQVETKARIALYRQWNPQVFVDLHEMGHQSSYFFPPAAKPINTNLPGGVEKWLDVFGRANADAFSQRGWPFFVGEHFDLFYPGYGDAWPSLHGAIGMTYEVAGGGRGALAVEREDGSILTLGDRVERHYTAAMTTIRTAAAHRAELIRYTAAASRASVEAFLIVPGSPNFSAMIELLDRQGIEVRMLTAPLTARANPVESEAAAPHTFPAGTGVVSTRQPLGALAQTLLERTPTMAREFVEEQRARAQADEPNDFYDLTTWSLPLAMNVETWVTPAAVGNTAPFKAETARPFRAASYGYLVDGEDPNVYRFAGALLEAGIRFTVSESELPAAGVTHSRGSLVVLKGNNGADVDATLQRIAGETRASVVPLESGWTGGTAFGSNKLRFVRAPKIALLSGPGTAPTSFGTLWHTLDVDTPVPHSVVAVDSLRNADLSRYNVLVFPDGDYADRIPQRAVERIQSWVRNGGTIVAVKDGAAFLRQKGVELSKLKQWEAPKPKAVDGVPPPQAEARYNEFSIPGSAFRSALNGRSYLTFGVPRPPALLLEGSKSFTPLPHRVDNVVTVAQTDPLISGIAWPESLERTRGAVFLAHERYERGSVITFADEPHFRLFWRGTLPLFLNAVLYSPSFQR